jgi:hypothetical protein
MMLVALVGGLNSIASGCGDCWCVNGASPCPIEPKNYSASVIASLKTQVGILPKTLYDFVIKTPRRLPRTLLI